MSEDFGMVVKVTNDTNEKYGYIGKVVLKDGREFWLHNVDAYNIKWGCKIEEILGKNIKFEKRDVTGSLPLIISFSVIETNEVEKSDVGIRYDMGKVRMDLIHPGFENMIGEIMTDNPGIRLDLIPKSLLVELGKVYTEGAKKYSPNNWRKGLKFTRCIGPIKRHLNKWIRGEVRDQEIDTHHLANVVWNCASLIEYEQTHPELDDRPDEWKDMKEE